MSNDRIVGSKSDFILEHLALGSEFLKNFEEATLLERAALFIGADLPELVRRAASKAEGDFGIGPADGSAAVRDRIGALAYMSGATERFTLLRSLRFSTGLAPIAIDYLLRRRRQLMARDLDIGLPQDPLASGLVSNRKFRVMAEQRRRDFSLLLEELRHPPRFNSPVDAPLLYVSGMPYSDRPSGYGRRTAMLVNYLRDNQLPVELMHLAWDPQARVSQNTILPLDNRGSLSGLVQRAQDVISERVSAVGACTLASGSNWLSGLVTLLAARKAGLPFIYDVRSLWAMTRAAIAPSYVQTQAYAIEMELEWAVMRAADSVVFISDALAEEAISHGVDARRVKVVPNAVPSIQSLPETLPPDDVWRLGYAGSLTRYEELELIIAIMAKTPNMAGRPLQLWIAGDGPHTDVLKKSAEEAGVDVIFAGYLPPERLMEGKGACHLMVYPRRSSPVFQRVPALKTVEAMALGRAVLMSDIKPHRELIGSSETRGWLAQAPGNSAETQTRVMTRDLAYQDCLSDWQAKIENALSNSEERRKRAEAARSWIEVNRTTDHAYAPWKTILRTS